MLSIQLPTTAHIDAIMALNRKYLISHLTDAEKQNGFIRIEYDKDELKQIIANKEMVVAIDNDKIVGYYLVGKRSGNLALVQQRNKALSLFDTYAIQYDKIGYGCQVCIDEAYRNNRLFLNMLNTLTKMVKNKYTHLLCSVSDDNMVSMKTHTVNGWILIDHFESTKFFIYKTYTPTI